VGWFCGFPAWPILSGCPAVGRPHASRQTLERANPQSWRNSPGKEGTLAAVVHFRQGKRCKEAARFLAHYRERLFFNITYYTIFLRLSLFSRSCILTLSTKSSACRKSAGKPLLLGGARKHSLSPICIISQHSGGSKSVAHKARSRLCSRSSNQPTTSKFCSRPHPQSTQSSRFHIVTSLPRLPGSENASGL